MRVIGLTGGIASGKSSVARLLEEQGVTVIDADRLARDAVLPGTDTLKEIVTRFGSEIVGADGFLDRTALAEKVFSDPAARKMLEEIVHPAIKSLAEKRLSELREAGTPVVVYMAPLLIEAGAIDRVDEVWVVYVDRESQLQRLMARDGITRESAGQRLAAQMPMEEKVQYGSVVIDNSGTPEDLAARVAELCGKEFPGSKPGNRA